MALQHRDCCSPCTVAHNLTRGGKKYGNTKKFYGKSETVKMPFCHLCQFNDNNKAKLSKITWNFNDRRGSRMGITADVWIHRPKGYGTSMHLCATVPHVLLIQYPGPALTQRSSRSLQGNCLSIMSFFFHIMEYVSMFVFTHYLLASTFYNHVCDACRMF